jgi:hypothetical protein
MIDTIDSLPYQFEQLVQLDQEEFKVVLEMIFFEKSTFLEIQTLNGFISTLLIQYFHSLDKDIDTSAFDNYKALKNILGATYVEANNRIFFFEETCFEFGKEIIGEITDYCSLDFVYDRMLIDVQQLFIAQKINLIQKQNLIDYINKLYDFKLNSFYTKIAEYIEVYRLFMEL